MRAPSVWCGCEIDCDASGQKRHGELGGCKTGLVRAGHGLGGLIWGLSLPLDKFAISVEAPNSVYVPDSVRCTHLLHFRTEILASEYSPIFFWQNCFQ